MTADHRELLLRYVICLSVLTLSLAVFPLAVLAVHSLGVPLPVLVSNVLFFWPQYLLLPNGVLDAATDAPYFTRAAIYVAALFWLVAVGAYVFGTRRVRRSLVLLGLLAAVAVVAQLGSIVLGAFDLVIFLDGP